MRIRTAAYLAAAALLLPALGACAASSSEPADTATAAVAAAGPVGGAGFVDTTWLLTSAAIDSADLAAFDITLEFTDTDAAGFGGVNRYSASFTSSPEGVMEFGEIASTMMAGPDDAMAAEAAYLAALGTVTGYTVDGSELDLFAGETEILTYSKG